MVMCLGQDADLHTAQLMPLPLNILCSKNPDWIFLSGASSPGWSRTKSKSAIKWLCVSMCACVRACVN